MAEEELPTPPDEDELEQEVTPGPIRRAFEVLSNIFWGLVIIAAILFAWPSHWGGPVTIAHVQGHSMEPNLYTGDIAIAIRNYQNNYAVGDIIVYRVQEGNLDGMVVHRITVRLDNGNYITQGDNKKMPDPWEIQPDWIFGKVVITIPGAAGWLMLIKSPVFIAIIAGAIVMWVVWPRRDELEPDENEGPEPSGSDPSLTD